MMKTYNPAEVSVSIAGIPITGIADGTFVKVARATESFSKTVGAGGEVARARSNDRSGEVTVTLMQTAAANDLLSALAARDELSGEGVGVFIIKDLRGTTLCHAPNAWIKKPADVEFGKDIGNREWVIDCDELDMFVGGAAVF